MDLSLKNKLKQIMASLDARRAHDSSDEEVWAVKRFLENKNIDKSEEIKIQPQESKVDVVFQECNFQIKRIFYPKGYRRGDEDKKFRKKIEAVKNKKQLTNACVGSAYDWPGYHSPDYLKDLIMENIDKYSSGKKGKNLYPENERCRYDLLFDIKQEDMSQKKLTPISPSSELCSYLDKYGWRSISYLFGGFSYVIYVSDHAPSLLKEFYKRDSSED